MKVSIVMAYFNRKHQIQNTLGQFERDYWQKYNFEVIIIDDCSKKEERLFDILKNYSFPIVYKVLSEKEKGNRINSCIPYNIGIQRVQGNIVLLQNPECYHLGDILNHFINNLREGQYFSYSCFTGNNTEISNEIIRKNGIDEDIMSRNYKIKKFNWYNHPLEKPSGYHFCNAIYKLDLDKVGHFDERLKDGYAFEDDMFLHAVKQKLNVQIIPPNPFVLHQYHETDKNMIQNKKLRKMWMRNKKIYLESI